MSRKSREKKLRKVWRQYLTKGKRWSREAVAKQHDCRVEDVQRLIDEAGPTKVQEIDRRINRTCCWRRRFFEGRLAPVRQI